MKIITKLLAAIAVIVTPMQVKGEVGVHIPLDWTEHLLVSKGTPIDLPSPSGCRVSVLKWPQTVASSYKEGDINVTRYYTEARIAGPFSVIVYELPQSLDYDEWYQGIHQELLDQGFKTFIDDVVYGEEAISYSDKPDADFELDFRGSTERRGTIFRIENFVYRMEITNCRFIGLAGWDTGWPAYQGFPPEHLGLQLETERSRLSSEVLQLEPYRRYGKVLNRTMHGLRWCSDGWRNVDYTWIKRNTYTIKLRPKKLAEDYGEFCPDPISHMLMFTRHFAIQGTPLVFGQADDYLADIFSAWPEGDDRSRTIFEERFLLEGAKTPTAQIAIALFKEQHEKDELDVDCLPFYLYEDIELLDIYEGEHQGYPTIEISGRYFCEERNNSYWFRGMYVLLDKRMYFLWHEWISDDFSEPEEWHRLRQSFEIK